jgi:hypothetical protein
MTIIAHTAIASALGCGASARGGGASEAAAAVGARMSVRLSRAGLQGVAVIDAR